MPPQCPKDSCTPGNTNPRPYPTPKSQNAANNQGSSTIGATEVFLRTACSAASPISKVAFQNALSGQLGVMFDNMSADQWDIVGYNPLTKEVCVLINGTKMLGVSLTAIGN